MSVFSRRRERGSYFIGLLVVLAILAFLMYRQLQPEETAQQVNTATYTIDRSKDAACLSNRAAIQQGVAMWQINHSGEAVTLEQLRASGTSVPGCPMGGEYSVSPDGREIYCSRHHPAPDAAGPPPGAAPVPAASPADAP